ncbi:MAG: GNAT family N-acetyltransferase [Herpetosiphonaceae bacterium]|nr:GNAT family N-acetyltransferase [Herpetosiphonaceae bacterium]
MAFEVSFIVRLCHPEDAPLLAPLIVALAMEEGEEVATPEEVATVVSALLESGASDFLLALIEDRPVGCMQIAYRLSTWQALPYAYIEDFYLAPEARRQGIGTKMLDYALQRADGQGSDCVQLDVRSANTPARRLYERFAFQDSGSILMKLPLPLGEAYDPHIAEVMETVRQLRGQDRNDA